MKILEKTDKILVIKSENSLSANLLFSSILIFLVFKHLIWLIGFSQAQVNLNCTQIQPKQTNCKLIQVTPLGKKNIIEIDNLQLATEKREQPRNRIIGLILKSENGDFNLEVLSENSIVAKQQINEFITKPKQPDLQIQFNYFWNNFVGFMIGALIVFWLSTSWLLSPVETCIFDKINNRLQIERKNLFNMKTFKFKLSEFDCSSLQTILTGYRIVLNLKNRETIILISSISKFNTELEKINGIINEFNH